MELFYCEFFYLSDFNGNCSRINNMNIELDELRDILDFKIWINY